MPTISLRITDEQKAEWTKKAEGQPLSDWIKLQCGAERTEPPNSKGAVADAGVAVPSSPGTSNIKDWIEATVARKVGHAPGCECYECARFRAYLKTSNQDS